MKNTETKYNSEAISETKLICKDYLVSNENFEIREYENGILKTFPVPENLSKYYESEDYISHSDSKENLQEKVYHLVKSYMLSKKAKWIKKYINKGHILDYGAGTGEFLNKMNTLGWNVEGIEPSTSARNLGISKGLKIHSELLELENDSYDVISLWHVLEHIPDFETKLSKFKDLLDDNGFLIIAVPNYNSYDAKYYKEHWAAWDVPRHLWHFSRMGISKKLSEHGFKLMSEKPLKFDSYYVSLLSEKNKNRGSNLLNAFYRGLSSNMKAKHSGEYSSIAYFFKKEAET
ncbi:class I SAM-dependent methyltransferase [Gramella sp. MAR_2010_147]|uniref:class I SAM-dependent methyltransferase n=1 Tax=Gramella sp. MAR_2010_147 TaxID=1250205 RepID=UPI00087D4E63|nr:class I SAM-dependent methyltransferase [Gramella sp. MAR_2010_147]SDS37919.1 Methyltransferase domain-containing protein [Gramella sp. MAR_2010_147]